MIRGKYLKKQKQKQKKNPEKNNKIKQKKTPSLILWENTRLKMTSFSSL